MRFNLVRNPSTGELFDPNVSAVPYDVVATDLAAPDVGQVWEAKLYPNPARIVVRERERNGDFWCSFPDAPDFGMMLTAAELNEDWTLVEG